MSVFPSLEPKYYMDTDYDLMKMMNESYAEMISINISFWSEADIDARFRSGDQTLWNDIYGNLPAYRRRDFNFNIINTPCNMIEGYQRQHRKQVTAAPVHQNDEKGAQQYSKCLIWANNYNNFSQTFSEACGGATTCGMNLLHCWMDYRSDPINGDIRWDNLQYNEFLMDPYCKKQDLSDCSKIWRRKYLTKNEAISLIPHMADEIAGMEGSYNKDGKFQFMPESYNYAMRSLLIYDEYYYKSTRSRTVLVDTMTGDTMEWKGDKETLSGFLKDFPNVKALDQEIPTVKLACLLNGKTVYHGQNPSGSDKYPFVMVPFYFNPEIPYYPQRIRGLVRDMRDPQYLFNRRMIVNLDIAESTVANGYYYKENALVNPNDIFMTGQGKGIAIKEEYPITEAIMPIVPPAPRPELMQLAEQLKDLVPRITGLNDELLGQAVDEKAGILAMLRQGAGLVTLQKIFDQWDLALKLCGELEMDYIQANWTPGKIARITEEEPVPEFYTKNFGKYDCVVEEAVATSTQRQLAFQQSVYLRELGLPITDEYILKLSTLQDKDKLIEEMAQKAQKQAEMEAKMQQVQIQESQARAEDMHARAVANQGLGYERASRVAENQALAVERRAAAIKDIESGNLDQIRAAKELQSMNIGDLEKLVNILKLLQEDSAKEAGIVGGSTGSSA